jgi:hypothetical protein
MSLPAEHQRDQAAFRALSGFIQQTYPPGQFVAIAGGRIIADAANFAELDSTLKALGQDSVDVLVVQAGVEYPESAVFFDEEEDILATGEMVDRMMADVDAGDPTLESYQQYRKAAKQ